MFQEILEKSGLEPKTTAGLLGVSPELFSDWITGKVPIPGAMKSLIGSVLGIPEQVLTDPLTTVGKPTTYAPVIWYKLRGFNLPKEDFETAVVMRCLAYHLDSFERVVERTPQLWKTLFETIRDSVDLKAAPQEQGRQAAKAFLDVTELAHGATGFGDALRGHLRSKGVLVLESPLQKSAVEGFAFYLGNPLESRPCIFSNNYAVTWFRANHVILHELCHLIFDVPTGSASVDFSDSLNAKDKSAERDPVAEARAQAFAMNALVSKATLSHIAKSWGIKWESLKAEDVSRLVAESHAEKLEVVAGAVEAGFLTEQQAAKAKSFDISKLLPTMSDRALSATEYLKKTGKTRDEFMNFRMTTVPSRAVQLPPNYVKAVLDACKERKISIGRAAEFLMIEKREFAQRFSAYVPVPLGAESR